MTLLVLFRKWDWLVFAASPPFVVPLIDGSVLEEERDALSVVGSAAGFGELVKKRTFVSKKGMSASRLETKTHSRTNVDGLDAVAEGLLFLVGDGVGDDQLGELGLVQLLDGVAREDAVGDDGNGAAGSVVDDDLGGLAQGAAGVGHIVNNDGDLAAHVADQNHARDLVGAGALLVDQGEAEIETVGDRGCSLFSWSASVFVSPACFFFLSPLGSTGVGRDNNTIVNLEVVADPAQGAGLGVEVVDRDVEEALNLTGVQVHGDDMVATGGLKHVSHQTRGDGCARLVLLVLAGVGKVGKDGGNAAGRGRLAGIDHD